jgi:hypothetical protein
VPHVVLFSAERSDSTVQFTLSKGLGYEYAWDFDADGKADTDWSAEPTTSHAFADQEFRQDMAVAVLDPPASVYAVPLQRRELSVGERWTLDPALLGPNWQREEGGDNTPPLVELTEEGLTVRRNGARLHRNGNSVDEDQVVLHRGDSIDVGRARLTGAGLVRVRALARNAFGVERAKELTLTLPDVPERPAVEVIKVAEATP